MRCWRLSVLGTVPKALAEAPASAFEVDLSERASQIAWIKGRFEGLTPGLPPGPQLSRLAHRPLSRHRPRWDGESALTFEDGEGRGPTLKRSGTSRWEGTVPPSGQLRIRYRLYGNSLEDRTRDIDDTHAFLNPAAVFPFVEALRDAPRPCSWPCRRAVHDWAQTAVALVRPSTQLRSPGR